MSSRFTIAGVMGRTILIVLLSLVPGIALAECQGESLFHSLKREDPEAYARIIAEGHKIANGQGNFWKIEKPDLPPSYLFGTFHSPAAIKLVDDHVWQALADARIALFEITAEDADAYFHGQNDMAATHDWDATPLRQKLSGPERHALDLALAERGMQGREADYMRATLLYELLSYPVCHQRLIWSGEAEILDSVVEKKASEHGIPVASLETVPDQDGALNKMPPEKVVRMLIGDGRFLSAEEDVFQSFVDLYGEKENGISFAFEIWLADQQNAGQPGSALYSEFDQWVLEHRNRVWLPRLLEEAETGGAFVAVGAAHLAQPYGLVALLREHGFTVTRQD